MKIVYYFLLGTLFFSCQKENIPTDNFWVKEDPTLHGLHQDSLDLALQQATNLPNLYALLVIKNGKLIVEEYYNDKNQNSLFHLRSITKNITSSLTGIAIEDGMLDSLDQSIKSYFPNISIEKEVITIRHLLNMTSGLTWNEDLEIIDLIEHQIPNSINAILARDLQETPGLVFNYNSLGAHIIGEVIAKTANQNFRTYAQNKLFEPLGIERFQWEEDSEGRVWGGFGLQLTGRDLAKFGQLYLNNGIWEGENILAPNWIQLSSTQQIATGTNTGYSLQWWIAQNLSSPVYYGSGYGGQTLMIIPEKNMAVIGLQNHLVSFEENAKSMD